MDEDLRRLFVGLPALRPREQFAVGVLAGDLQHRDLGQRAGLGVALAVSGDDAFLVKFLEDALQGDAVGAFDAELAREIALGVARGEGLEDARLVETIRLRRALWV